MKRIIILLLLIASIGASAQTTTLGGKKTTVKNLGAFTTDSVMGLPLSYPVTNFTASDSAGRIWYEMATKSVWYHNGTIRVRIGSVAYIDSVALANTGQHQYIFKAANVNAATVANRVLGETASSYGRFITTVVIYVVKTFTGTVVIPPTMSVGYTASAYADVFPATALSSTPTVDNPRPAIPSTAISIPPSTTIYTRISVGATFSTTGSYVMDVYIQGYYETL